MPICVKVKSIILTDGCGQTLLVYRDKMTEDSFIHRCDNVDRCESKYGKGHAGIVHTEQKVYFHINTLFTNIGDRVIIAS